ncbi:MAG: hypothetical protein ACP5FP_10280, partial [Desulfuromonadaceae bacterium]
NRTTLRDEGLFGKIISGMKRFLLQSDPKHHLLWLLRLFDDNLFNTVDQLMVLLFVISKC